jgi:cell wall assembly regulator SMI1
VEELWLRLKTWLDEHSPDALDTLNGPAEPESIETTERHVGRELPQDYKALLLMFDGDEVPGMVWPNGFTMLDSSHVSFFWAEIATMAAEMGWDKLPDRPEMWKVAIESRNIGVIGPVKPLEACIDWVPIMQYDTDYIFLDYDPAPGGTPGQVIEASIEGGQYRVLAPSFRAFMEQYVDDLEGGKYEASERGHISRVEPRSTGFGEVPEWLQEVTVPKPDLTATSSTERPFDQVAPGEQVTYEGRVSGIRGTSGMSIFELSTANTQKLHVMTEKDMTTAGYDTVSMRSILRVTGVPYDTDIHPPPLGQWTIVPDLAALEIEWLGKAEKR